MTTAVLTSERSDMDLLIRPNISDIEEEAGAISLNNLSSPPSFNERHDAESSKDGERDDRGEGYKDDSEIKRSVKILVTGTICVFVCSSYTCKHNHSVVLLYLTLVFITCMFLLYLCNFPAHTAYVCHRIARGRETYLGTQFIPQQR